MICMLAAPRAEFFNIQFLAARLTPQGVIQIAVLFARQKYHFRLFFAFGHNLTRKSLCLLRRNPKSLLSLWERARVRAFLCLCGPQKNTLGWNLKIMLLFNNL
jgi:hypothetical protein